MPELPEVQTTANGLDKQIRNARIISAWMDPQKPINTGSNMSWSAMRKSLKGQHIKTVTRRAKYVVISFRSGAKLWVHQKMTGHLLVGDQPQDSHGANAIRVTLSLANGRQVALCDVRRFGRIIFTPTDSDIPNVRELAQLGPEPLPLSQKKFQNLFRSKRGLIKPVLMDPSFIVGIGNIYADEILHQAAIHPLHPVARLTSDDLGRIYRNMKKILATAIKLGGSSTDDYRNPTGTMGGYQDRHRAYQRTGQQCLVCRKGTIERLVHAGRSSHFCSYHQLLP